MLPALSVMAPTNEGLATPILTAPEPILVIEEIAGIAVVSKLTVPAPAMVRACAPATPPRILRTSVASAPMVAAPERVMSPLAVLVRLEPVACKAPPELIPEPVRPIASKTETPASWRAAPVAVTVVAPEARPRAPAFVTFKAPWLTEIGPDQIPLSAAKTKVPISAFVKPLLARPKAELMVQVVPLATSRTLFAVVALLKTMVRLVEMLLGAVA